MNEEVGWGSGMTVGDSDSLHGGHGDEVTAATAASHTAPVARSAPRSHTRLVLISEGHPL